MNSTFFLLSFEQVLCDIIAINALFVLVTGDFDAIVANWWKNDRPPLRY